ncbi:MAG: flagellar biosynthesis protein FlhA [Treponemataceae bacterium]|nr:flagellar biosynthesis protein FlhA [Treponemataceae bacterium]
MAVAVVTVIMMIMIPLPTVLLDVLMATNVLLSLLILLIVVYSPRAIDFSSFPTVLLISTVFGLGLNVSSTRLILTKGLKFDGQMVRAFSSFVIGAGGTEGILIGFVIFIIIIAVQTFVITKGATRVAEVAARFTLDAMPMKQAAIESEYNQGSMTEEELRQRKMDVQREADFYGSMDGATKFVSNNVKVGIFITIINLVVGLIFGMVLRGENFSTAIGTYAALTIGDGLLSQVPSLMVSFATGLIVTRSVSDGKTTLGDDISLQFTQSSLIYYVGAGVMAVMGVLPGFPWYVLEPMAAGLGFIGWRLKDVTKNREAKAAKAKADKQAAAAAGPSAPVQTQIKPPDPLSLELGLALLPLVEKEKGAELIERIRRMRNEAANDYGLVVPNIRIVDNMRLDPNEYCFKIKGVEIGRFKLRLGNYMCMNSGDATREIKGEATIDPAFGLPAVWIPEDKREEAERAGYAVIDPPTIIATHLTELIRTHADEILGREEVRTILDVLKKEYPAVVEEATGSGKFTTGEIQKVLQGLLREQVSIRNMVVILETMCDYGSVTKDPSILVEKVRQALGRQLCLQYADGTPDGGHVLRVVTVDQQFLAKLVESRVNLPTGPIAALEPRLQGRWIQALSATMASIRGKGFMPVLWVPDEARILVKKSTEREIPKLVVLAASEITPDINVEIIGEVQVG